MQEQALVIAGKWVAHFMTGALATAVAIIAIAALGLSMLAGHIPWRRGIEAVLGVLVIFGAPMLVEEILAGSPQVAEDVPATISAQHVSVQPPAPSVYDPYAGASVSVTRAPSDLISPRP